MKKRTVRLLAMLLCVLSFTALLPTVAFAAEPETIDAVGNPLAGITLAVKNSAENAIAANGKVYKTFKVTARLNKYWYIQDPYYWNVPVRYQWYVKKGSGKKFTKVKGATGYRYTFKATKGKNGWTYRLKVINAYRSSNYLYLDYKIKVKK